MEYPYGLKSTRFYAT